MAHIIHYTLDLITKFFFICVVCNLWFMDVMEDDHVRGIIKLLFWQKYIALDKKD